MNWKKWSLIFVVLFSIIIIGLKFSFPQRNYMAYDSFGNYLFLPATFIYNDLALEGDWYKAINEKYQCTPSYYQFMQTDKGNTVIRFYMGMSLLWTPAFFTGHLYALATDYPEDGFSKPYQWALVLYGALFSILGLIVSRKILLQYFSEKITAITLLVVFVGSNLFFFITIGNDVPHGYLFTLFAALILFTIKWHQKHNYTNALLIGVSLGLIIAVRPSDGIAGIIPLLWGVVNKKSFLEKLSLVQKYWAQLAAAISVAIILFLPQLFYNYLYGGSLILNVYNDAASTLNLSNPRIGYVLFGFRKGWFIYSPLSLLGIAGLVIIYKKLREYFWPAILFILINIYLIASFTSLVSYGWRAFIESYAILLIPTAFVVETLSRKSIIVKSVISIILLFFMILNLHQAWQVRMGIIDGSRMTKEYYFAVLGKSKVSLDDRKLLMVERSGVSSDEIPKEENFMKVELVDLGFNDQVLIDSLNYPVPFEGSGAFLMGNGTEFSPGLKIPYDKITSKDYCYLKASAYVYADSTVNKDNIFLVLTTSNDDGHLKYRTVSFKDDSIAFTPNNWNKLEIEYLTPEIIGDAIISCYVWYAGSEQIWVDKLVVTAYTLD